MTPALPKAADELARWREEGRTLPVWWRDDDAIAPTPALDRLIDLARKYDAPLHLAVIPAFATAELADRLKSAPATFVLTHGWRHANHAPVGEKKAEYGSHRPLEVMLGEAVTGRRRLDELFGDQVLPIFTPPWNRIASEVVAGLSSAGFAAISAFTPRRARFAADGLLQVNTHLDPIAWKTGGGLLDPTLLDEQLARELEARRLDLADNAEPYGLITHHLVHDEPFWTFAENTLELLSKIGVARWTPPLGELSR
jgi:peptidoglycan/xylan/chitin deacetylase (PgdA/CDA1 family)